MPPPIALSQDLHFYKCPWSRNIETIVLGKLLLARQRGDWIPGRHEQNKACVQQARDELINETDVDISIGAFHIKVVQWEERYRQFTWLQKREGVVYDGNTNEVTATDRIWTRTAEMRPEMLVYKDEGEVNWTQLSPLFDNIIMISDSSDTTSYTAASRPSAMFPNIIIISDSSATTAYTNASRPSANNTSSVVDQVKRDRSRSTGGNNRSGCSGSSDSF